MQETDLKNAPRSFLSPRLGKQRIPWLLSVKASAPGLGLFLTIYLSAQASAALPPWLNANSNLLLSPAHAELTPRYVYICYWQPETAPDRQWYGLKVARMGEHLDPWLPADDIYCRPP